MPEKMKPRLSIIMPCYNCASTLEESLDSAYAQALTIPFEIIMVDDGSTDKTAGLIKKLASKHPEIKTLAHEINRGGGAARNTGIKNSSGELIFCLDSDNVLGPGSLNALISYLSEKKADAVAFGERRFFIGNNLSKFRAEKYPVTSEPFPFIGLFKEKAVLLDNFLFTKESFLRTEGYPEHHGFDTQCFEIRYLLSGAKLYIVPDAIFYHRQVGGKKSYFERVYESGEFSKNFYLIYEDLFCLFSPETRKAIINFNIFRQNTLDDQSLPKMIEKLYMKDPGSFLVKNYEKFTAPSAFEDTIDGLFCKAIFLYKDKKFKEALDCYATLAEKGLDTPILHFNMLRNTLALAYPNDLVSIEKRVSAVLDSMSVKRRRIDMRNGIIRRIINKIKNEYDKTAEN